jgi:serine phosphatase RsbU (regulator of sigma subunit)
MAEADARLASALVELASLLHAADQGAMLQRVAELAAEHIPGVDEAGITVPRDGHAETRGSTSTLVLEIDEAQYSSDDGPCLQALRDGRVYEVRETDVDDRWPAFAAAARQRSIHSSLSMPLSTEGERLGALNLYAHASDAFLDATRQLARTFAAHAAVSVANARAYRAAVDVALTLQRSLLPDRLPLIAGLEFAARYEPASDERIGGDWYDVVTLASGAAVTIGDVAGHGVRAAAVMGQLRTACHAYALAGHAPSTTVGLLHQLFAEMGFDGMATLCHLTLSHVDAPTTSTRVRVANAGHLPPLLRLPDSSTRYLETVPDPPLGSPAPRNLGEASVDVESGSVLLLYTDGLIERRHETLDAGLARLQAAVHRGPADIEALSDHVMRTLLPDDAADDAALLAILIRHVPQAGEAGTMAAS